MFLFFNKPKTEQDKELLKFLKNILGLKPGNILLYKTALIHKSKSHTDSRGHRVNNERLEYLGDTVLSTIIGDYLFKKYPHHGEGFLTEMRSKIVSRSSLNSLSKRIGLSQLIEYTHGRGGGFISMSGDAFEALTGAIYLDKGYDFTYKVLINRIFTSYMDVADMETIDWNYKSKIIDWGQKTKHRISYQVVDVTEFEKRKQYKIQIFIDSFPQEKAIAFSIKAAEQLASEKTYKRLQEHGFIE
ncbi:MAG: ribonuclease III [Bacteroidales bacterium]|nr:ribonuclease III [Bacteroidales bacterium]